MTRLLWAATALAVALPAATSAQESRIRIAPRAEGVVVSPGRVEIIRGNRLMLGITTSSDSERADTLGLLIEDVMEDSPAAKAGLKEGDRLQAINGTSLRASPADAGQEDYEGILARRLTREMGKVKDGDEIELRVYSDGRSRTMRVKPVEMSELYGERGVLSLARVRNDDRAVLGVTISSSGSARDTLGVFVSAVSTDGPAEKSGIVEGDRIAAINGVSVRVAREDANDPAVGAAKTTRLLRELEKLKAGDVAELTVITAGRSRTVRVTTIKASDLPSGSGGAYGFMLSPSIEGTLRSFSTDGGGVWVAPTPPAPPAPARTTWRTRIVTI